LRYSDHIEGRGEEMYDAVRQMRLEGIMAKRADSIYVEDRSPSWLKIRVDRTADFVIVGFSPARGSRAGFGALHLADFDGDELVYAGRVGSGFTDILLAELHERLASTRRRDPPCKGNLPGKSGHTWVDPTLACEVRYKERTAEGQLRHPVFLQLREDKPIEDCVRADGPAGDPETPTAPPPVEKQISFTNLGKIFWPAEGYTKGDLIEYYRAVGPWLLPYLEDRPLVLTRYPDGIEGKSFFQKDAPSWVPDWIRTERMWSEHAKREIHYFIADDVETLLYLANMATIPLHLWSSRLATLQRPDWCILDLDPKDAPFEHVIRIARALRALCEEIDLEPFIKTSGSTGLHVLIPLGRQISYEQSRSLGGVLARVITTRLPEISTIARATAARKGRVYVDYLQNGHGRLLVAPYCVRPLPAAPVSAPLRWTEVRKGLDIRKFTIKTLPRRLARLEEDPLSRVMDLEPDLPATLEKLAALL
jgi:bifunctional non-homologous end joining protein LigD